MKYFAHIATARADDKFDRLFLKYSFEGYGVFWYICEMVAQRKKTANDNPGWCVNSAGREHVENTPRTRFISIVSYLSEIGLIDCKKEDGLLILCVPKLNAYSAEYQKKLLRKISGQTPDIVRTASVSTPERLSIEENRIEEKRKERSRSTLTPDALGASAELVQPLASPDALRSAFEKAGLQEIMPSLGKNTKPAGNGKDEIRVFTLPADMTAAQDSLWKGIKGCGIIQSDQVDRVTATAIAYREGEAEAHELAGLLNEVGVKGEDKVKVYAVIGI